MATVGIDDERDLLVDYLYKTGEQALEEFSYEGQIDILYMDHDLGSGINGAETIRRLLDMGLRPKQVHIVSNNPVGRDNIGAILEYNYKYKRLNPYQFLITDQTPIASTAEDWEQGRIGADEAFVGVSPSFAISELAVIQFNH